MTKTSLLDVLEKPGSEESSEPGESGYDDDAPMGLESAASEMMEAVKASDPKELARALRAAFRMLE